MQTQTTMCILFKEKKRKIISSLEKQGVFLLKNSNEFLTEIQRFELLMKQKKKENEYSPSQTDEKWDETWSKKGIREVDPVWWNQNNDDHLR